MVAMTSQIANFNCRSLLEKPVGSLTYRKENKCPIKSNSFHNAFASYPSP